MIALWTDVGITYYQINAKKSFEEKSHFLPICIGTILISSRWQCHDGNVVVSNMLAVSVFSAKKHIDLYATRAPNRSK